MKWMLPAACEYSPWAAYASLLTKWILKPKSSLILKNKQTNKKKQEQPLQYNISKIWFWELELIQISAVFARQWFIFVCGGWLILIALISYVINKIVIIIYLSHMMKSLVCQPLHSISVITFYFFRNIWIFHWWR